MKIREDLVFNKATGEIIGFVDYGEQSFDDRFADLREQCKKGSKIKEKTIATHMLALMVRGIFFKMDIPIAQFSTTGVLIFILCCISHIGIHVRCKCR